MTAPSYEGAEHVAELRRVLLETEAPRIEFERTWNGVPCLRIYEQGQTKGGNPKWTKVGPLLFGPVGTESHTEVLTHLINLLENPA